MQKIYLFLVILLVVEILLASLCAPYSCEWGNGLYFYAGIGITLVLLTLPLLRKKWTMQKRAGFAVLFTLASIVVWICCFMFFDFRIICRLF